MSEAPLGQVRGWMASAGAGAAFVSDPVSIAYLTGFRAVPHERLMALIVREDEAVLVVPGLEEERAAAKALGVRLRPWRDGTDPWVEVAPELGQLAGALAVEKDHLRLAAWERLEAISGAELPLDVGRLIRQLRARKRPEELAWLEEAARITDAMAERGMAAAAPGRTELEVANDIVAVAAESGAQLSFDTIVQSGPNSAQPHLGPGGRRLEPGDLVLVDCGAAWNGYKADISRTVVLGRPERRQEEAYDAVLRAHDAALAVLRPGVTAGEVDRAAREVIESAGFGRYFIHRTGHGLGLEAHEDPSLDPGSSLALQAEMVVTIEPGVYIPGWGGIRLEDDAVLTDSGFRLLTSARRGLELGSGE